MTASRDELVDYNSFARATRSHTRRLQQTFHLYVRNEIGEPRGGHYLHNYP